MTDPISRIGTAWLNLQLRTVVITFYCTSKLAKRIGCELERPVSEPSSLLGNWYANLFNFGSQRWVLFLNERSNLPVLVRARKADFPERFPMELARLLRAIGVPPDHAERESRLSSEIRFAKATDRSLLGSLNDMAYHMSFELSRAGDAVAAAAVLSEMPCRLRNTIFPDKKVYELLGISSVYGRERSRRLCLIPKPLHEVGWAQPLPV